MTVLQKPSHSGAGHGKRHWCGFGHGTEAVRHTEAWEHETFAEEQARWERNDPPYAQVCDLVRQAQRQDGEALLRADQAKADWDARVATRRQADDDAEKAHHAMAARANVACPVQKSWAPTGKRE